MTFFGDASASSISSALILLMMAITIGCTLAKFFL
jgi:hypothetical protein